MAQTIDLLEGIVKTKISLAVDTKTVDLIDDALLGFRLISMLSNNDGNLEVLTGEKNYAIFKSLLNRSEMINKLIQAVRSEKVFVLGTTLYSLNDLRDFAHELASNIDIDYQIDPTINCNLDKDYLDNEWGKAFIEQCKDMTVEETIKTNRREIQHIPLTYKNENYYDFVGERKLRGIEKMGLFPEILEHNQFANEQAYMFDRDIRNQGFESTSSRWDELTGVLGDILPEIFKNSSYALSLEMKCKIVRNKLFNENHPTMINILDSYYAMICPKPGTRKRVKPDETP